MEEEILKIINQMLYQDKIDELYNKKEEIIIYPIKVNKINFKVLSDFNEQYFNKFEQLIIENAILYALKNKDKFNYYLDFIENNINNLSEELNENVIIKIKTTELAFYNIQNKEDKIDNELKEKYSDLFNKINLLYINLNPITTVYRNIIMDFIDVGDDMNKERLLDTIFYTSNYDNYLISVSKGVLNSNNIELYKYILIRLILSDNYLYIESLLKEDEYDEHLKELKIEYQINTDFNDYQNEYEDESNNIENVYKEINLEILNFIKNNIFLNKFSLPKDDEIRYQIYMNFITYNEYTFEREYDFDTIKNDDEKVLNLKKINPLYKIDLIKKEND